LHLTRRAAPLPPLSRTAAADAAQVYVIGDTPLDVHCARAHGHRSIAVATGLIPFPPFLLLRRRTTRLTRPPVGRYSEAELAQAGADAVLSDLSDLRHVLACLGLDDAPAG
jgi:phosphoglycolate phosphatase-like HAD superfamily hydrolase